MDKEFIDSNSLIAIINRLKLTIENEEKIISNIKICINNLESFYTSDNLPLIKKKKENLFNDLNIVLNNRKSYVEYISQIVNKYVAMDKKNYINYNKYDIS